MYIDKLPILVIGALGITIGLCVLILLIINRPSKTMPTDASINYLFVMKAMSLGLTYEEALHNFKLKKRERRELDIYIKSR